MIRIFLTGDNHIGLKYASHEQAAVLAQKRIDAFGPMVQRANDEDCDLFVIAGDLFDRTSGIGKKTIRELLNHLSGFRGTVVVLPGNHDFWDEDAAVWKDFREEIGRYDNIMLLTDPEPKTISLDDREAVLYPAICTERHSRPGENNLGWIKKEAIFPDCVCRIGLAHGAIEGVSIDQEGAYFQMSPEELERIPVDVWLIGHTHVPYPRDLTEEYREAGKIFNAGSHVQNDVSTNTEGLCFVIEIADDKKVRAKKIVSGNLRFHRIPVRVTAGNMKDELSRAVEGFGKDSVVELILSGAVTDEEYGRRKEILDGLLAGFIEGSWTDYGLSRLITEDLIDAEYPETGIASGLLKSLLNNPREAQLAYDLLKEMEGTGK